MSTMIARALRFEAGGAGVTADPVAQPGDTEWYWIDVVAGPGDIDDLESVVHGVGLDALAVRDALDDLDLPKFDDFGASLLVVLHALAEDSIATFEIDCFVTASHLVTIHGQPSAALDALWELAQGRSEIAGHGAGEMLARLADVVTRRLVTVLDVFDDRNEELIERALRADPAFLGEIMAVRTDLATLRRAIHPQREAIDLLRRTSSHLVTDRARRRFSDVFDLATRASSGVDAARTALAETLDGYRGAEARQANEVTKVLTFYAAVMLPLSLVVGFFGMNFENLPLIEDDGGWLVVTVAMAFVALVSLGMFISLGWARRPSGRRAGVVLGRGLIEAARTPVEVVGAVYEISTMPLRGVTHRRKRS